MAITLDGTLGITTPSETNTGTLSVTGVTTLTGGLNAALPVLSGGTGVTTKTGTGAVVLGTSPQLTTPSFSSTNGFISLPTIIDSVTAAAPLYVCRAWVNFNGTGTVVIRASGNVSSITDNGTGDYTVNFTTAMPDANYCVTTGFTRDATNNNYGMYLQPGQNTGAFYATTFVRVYSGYAGAGTLYDMAVCHVAIFR